MEIGRGLAKPKVLSGLVFIFLWIVDCALVSWNDASLIMPTPNLVFLLFLREGGLLPPLSVIWETLISEHFNLWYILMLLGTGRGSPSLPKTQASPELFSTLGKRF